MSEATEVLNAEIDRVSALLTSLKEHRETLRKTREAIRAKIENMSAGTGAEGKGKAAIEKTVKELRIEDEQTAEHERLLDHQIAERSRVLDEFARVLEMTEDSSVV